MFLVLWTLKLKVKLERRKRRKTKKIVHAKRKQILNVLATQLKIRYHSHNRCLSRTKTGLQDQSKKKARMHQLGLPATSPPRQSLPRPSLSKRSQLKLPQTRVHTHQQQNPSQPRQSCPAFPYTRHTGENLPWMCLLRNRNLSHVPQATS